MTYFPFFRPIATKRLLLAGGALAASRPSRTRSPAARARPCPRPIRSRPTIPKATSRCAGRGRTSARSRVAYRRCRQNSLPQALTMPDIPGFPADQLERGCGTHGRWPTCARTSSARAGGDLLAHRRSACGLHVRRPSRPCAHRLFYRRAGIRIAAPANGGWTRRPPVPRRRQRQGVRHRADDQQRRMVEPRGSRTATTSASTPRRRSTARRQAAPTSRRRRRSSRAPTATSTPTPRTSGSAASTIRRCCNRTATTSPASRTPTSRSVTRSCSPIPRTRARPTWSSRATRRPARCTHLHQRGSRLRAERSVQGRSQRGDEFGRSVSKGQCRLGDRDEPAIDRSSCRRSCRRTASTTRPSARRST